MKMIFYFGLFAGVAMVQPALGSAAAPSALRFRDMEFEQPRDPMVRSTALLGDVRITPSDQIAPAVRAIETAVPVGTSAAAAVKTLSDAGARCRVDSAGEDCVYHDIQTVDEYTDDVKWDVRLRLANGSVQDASVQRSWSRH